MNSVNRGTSVDREGGVERSEWNHEGKKGALREVGHFVRHVEKLQWLVFSFFITITLALFKFIFPSNPQDVSSTINKYVSFGFLIIWSVLLPIGYTRLNNAAYAIANKLEDQRMESFPSSRFLYAHNISGNKRHVNSPLDLAFWGVSLLFTFIFSFILCNRFGWEASCLLP